ncbi:DMT family transporter [Neisseria sp. Ec49-e6-T10]|uniref:DMT family transporter n=1 Tax=Neisseria sp. Ec49-e6-T10 TaxID=3140744 RepID=UPI003EBC2482
MTRKNALFTMHIAALLFGVSGIFGVLIQTDTNTIVLGRGLFAFIAMSLMCYPFKVFPWQGLRAKDLVLLLLVGILLTLHWLVFFLAVKTGGVAVATLGFASFPAFIAVFESIFFREKLSKNESILIVCVSLGLVLVTPTFQITDQGTIGLLWGVLSGFLYAVITLLNRFSSKRLSGIQMCWWQYLALILVLFPFAGHTLSSLSWLNWFWLACLGLFCTGLAYYLFVRSLVVLKGRLAAIIIALEPVYAIIVAWILFYDVPSIRMVIGAVLIIGAVVWAGQSKTVS